MPNAIMIALGKSKKKPGMHSEPDEDEMDDAASDDDADDIEVSDEEKMAAKAAFDAKSPEEYAKALKAFVHLCYAKHEEEEY